MSYALLTDTAAQVTGFRVGDLVHSLDDRHRYMSHLDQARLRLSCALPEFTLNPSVTRPEDFRSAAITITDYDQHPGIKAPISA